MEDVLYLYIEFTRERRSFKPSLVLWYAASNATRSSATRNHVPHFESSQASCNRVSILMYINFRAVSGLV